MKTLHFSTRIDAPADIVWDTLLADATYRHWAGVFAPGSRFEGSWSPGSEIRFLGDSDDDEPTGGIEGMVGVIAEHRPREFVSIEYTGVIRNGDIDTESDYARALTGNHENYTVSESDGFTTLTVDLDVDDDEADMFEDMWPPALEKVSELAETARRARTGPPTATG